MNIHLAVNLFIDFFWALIEFSIHCQWSCTYDFKCSLTAIFWQHVIFSIRKFLHRFRIIYLIMITFCIGLECTKKWQFVKFYSGIKSHDWASPPIQSKSTYYESSSQYMPYCVINSPLRWWTFGEVLATLVTLVALQQRRQVWVQDLFKHLSYIKQNTLPNISQLSGRPFTCVQFTFIHYCASLQPLKYQSIHLPCAWLECLVAYVNLRLKIWCLHKMPKF